jgi:LacI family transcriptional regulator
MVATLKDIAKQTGLSVPSVSLILNGQGHKFRTESCKAVFAAARALKYRPDMVMRRMGRASTRRDAIGLLVRSDTSASAAEPAVQEYMAGINDYLLERDQLMVVVNVNRHLDNLERNPPRLLTERFVDGMIVVDIGLPPCLQAMIEDYEIMAVWLRSHCNQQHDCVTPDDVHGGQIATEHLLQMGHKRIMFVPTPWAEAEGGGNCDAAKLRQQGYEQAMASAGLESRIACTSVGNPDQAFHDVIDNLVASHRGRDAVTAVVTGSFDLAIKTISSLNLTPLRCPRDLSIVSAGDMSALHDAWPNISRVCCDRYAIGRHAAELLIRKVEQNGQPQPSRVFRGQIVSGATSAAPS